MMPIANLMQMFQMLKSNQNPMQALQQMAGNNQPLMQVLSVAKGKTPQQLEQFTRNYAKTNGIDINAFLSQLGMK